MIDAVQHALQDKSVLNTSLYFGGAAAGVVLNWASKWLRGEIDCLFDMVRSEFKRTIGSMIGQLGAIAAFVATGVLDDSSVAVSIALGLGFGFGIDALINKGQSKVWTAKERKNSERAEITSIKKTLRIKK